MIVKFTLVNKYLNLFIKVGLFLQHFSVSIQSFGLVALTNGSIEILIVRID